MPSTLIIVESPSKAKKIQGYLGAGYTVKASMGHICDLPAKEYGVDLVTFTESYEVRRVDQVATLKKLAKQYDRVLLASDPDREGESIAWHLARELKLDVRAAQRIEFHEITENAIKAAVAVPRPIHLGRVDAQRSRRVLDRIVGFDVSKEICWPAGAQSAGRVQTPALHILCERERAILAFVSLTYWTVEAVYGEGFTAFIPEPPKAQAADGAETEADAADDPEEVAKRSGRLLPRKFLTKKEADAAIAQASTHPHVVTDVARRQTFKRPEQPYTTSTMQQDASRKLRLTAKAAADLAQSLFEAGYITYHRTDSTRVSDEAVQMARDYILKTHPKALPATANKGKTKAGAQDAHEAIRPTHLEGDGAPPAGTGALYDMIKARFLASQSKPAEIERTTINIKAGPVPFVAEGSVLIDPGYLVFWGPYAKQDDELLPKIAANQTLAVTKYNAPEKKTAPPSRYDEGGLIKKLETSGVGRPSTYAMIIDTLIKRNYVAKVSAGRGKEVLQPTEFGLQVDSLLTASFPDIVAESYTSSMESELDAIEAGSGKGRVPYLSAWYRDFRAHMTSALPLAEAYRTAHGLKSNRGPGGGEETTKDCDRCGKAKYRKIQRKGGKGSFLACPECKMMRNVQAKVKPGACGKCGSALIEKQGREKGKSFFGCVRYGAEENPCDFIEGSGAKGGGRYTRAETTKNCPKCGTHTLVTLTPKDPADGQGFYACSDTACKFTLPLGARRRKAPCPDCRGAVLERRQRPTAAQTAAGEQGKAFWACARYPDCKYAQDITAE